MLDSPTAAAFSVTQALERLDQIEYAVLERDGTISIVPRRPEKDE